MTYSATAPVKLLAGTASDPSLTFAGGPGLFSPGPNQLAVTTGGVQRLLIGSDGSIASSGSLSGSSLSISGQSVRTTALQETSLPIALDATAMPGASVLGNDGQVYTSIGVGEIYQWSKGAPSLESGEIFLGLAEPRVNFLTGFVNDTPTPYVPALQIEGLTSSGASLSVTGSGSQIAARLILGRSRSTETGGNTILQADDTIGSLTFNGSDGVSMVPGAAINGVVDATPSLLDVPMRLQLRTRAQGSGPGLGIANRVTITHSGNVLINNTTGTERLDVTGNIKASGDLLSQGFRLGNAPPIFFTPAPGVPPRNPRYQIGSVQSSLPEGVTQSSVTDFLFYSQGTASPRLILGRSNDNGGVPEVISVSGVTVGLLECVTWTGVENGSLGRFSGILDGLLTPGSTPGSWRIETTASGSIFPGERMRITSTGNVLIGNTTGTQLLSVTGNAQLTESTNSYMIGSNNVVGSRKTGWAAPTGTATRTAFDTTTATVQQLAERLKALIDDLTSHGLVGA